MQVEDNKVISILYTLTNDSGNVIDESTRDNPLNYLHGAGNIISGLEKALHGKATGDKLDVTIAPADAYGVRQDNMVQTVAKDMFQGMGEIESGMQFQAEGNTGPVVVTVVKVEGDEVTIDGNHPLAGETLTFAVEITEIRDATEDELQHGHVHGEGCDHH